MAAIFAIAWGTTMSNVHAWGSEHGMQAAMVREALPQDLRARIDPVAMAKFAHYPDSFEPFGDDVKDDIKAILAEGGIKVRYDLHKVENLATVFRILVTLFAEGRDQEASAWCGAMTHTVGDFAAVNHHPLMMWWCFAFKGKPGLDGKPFNEALPDMNKTLASETGKQALASIMAGYTPKPLDPPTDGIGAMVRLMSADNDEILLMNQATGAILDAVNARLTTTDEPARKTAQNTIDRSCAALFAEPAKNIVDAIAAAAALAAEKKPVTTQDVATAIERFQKIHEQSAKDRKIADESIFAGLLADNPAATVAVCVEPTYRMNYCQLGIDSKFYAAAAMRALKDANIPYASYDIRDIGKTGAFPDPAKTPILVLASVGNPNDYGPFKGETLRGALANYAQAGGRILQIGQQPGSFFPDLVATAVKNDIPGGLPFPEEKMPSLSMKTASGQTLPLIMNPFTPAGWHRPSARTFLKLEGDGTRPIASLVCEGDEKIVSAYSQKDGQPAGAFLAQITLHPLIYDASLKLAVNQAQFDPVGSGLFIDTVRALQEK